MESGCSPHSCLQFIFKKLYFRTHTPTFSITFVFSSPVTLIAAAAAKSLQLCPVLLPPHRQKPTRLPCPWDAPGKNTGVGCHFLLQCMKVNQREVAQSCPTLSNPMDYSLPRLLHSWDFPGKSTGVGCHCRLHTLTAYLINTFFYILLNNLLNYKIYNKGILKRKKLILIK